MSDETDVNDLYDQATRETGKPRDEIAQLVLKKQEKFSGLLTESGALFLVAKELGVIVNRITDFDDGGKQTAKVGELKSQDRVRKMTVELTTVYPKRRFDKNGKVGEVQNVLVQDETGSITWTLWNEAVAELEKQGVGRGTKVELRDFSVRERDGRTSIQLDNGGSFHILQKAIVLPITILDIKDGDQDIVLEGRLTRKFAPKLFEKNDRKGQLGRFVVEDTTGSITGVAWNDAVLQLELTPVGSKIRLENAYAKKNLNGEVELHMGWQCRMQVLEAGVEGSREMTIGSLVPEKSGVIRGQVMELDCLKSYYEACSTCGKKVEKREADYYCGKCGKTTAQPRAMAKFFIRDETGEMGVVAFGSEAEKVWGKTALELQVAGIEELDHLVQTKKNQFMILEGMVRQNPYSGRLEMNAQRVSWNS